MKSHKVIVIVLVFGFVLVSTGYGQRTAEQLYQSALYKEEIEGELDAAIKIYETIIKQYPENRPVSAKSLLHSGICKERLGMKEAQKSYERVVREYSDQSDIVAQAKERLSGLSSPNNKKEFVARRILQDATGVEGRLTSDGRYITGLNLEKGDVYQFDITSGQKSVIKNTGPWSEFDMESMFQVFSPDGKQIVYDSYTKDWNPQLVIRNLDGSEIRALFSEKDSVFYPFDWSSDLKLIVGLLGNNNSFRLALISTTDGSVKVLRDIPSGLFMFEKACFSPDGKLVAFSFVRNSDPPNGDIFLLTSDGRNEIIVAGHPSEDQLIGWTPEGKNLLFRSDRSGTWDIWSVRITNGKQQGEPEQLKKDFGYYPEVCGIAPDGSFYYRVSTPSGSLYSGTVDLETGKILTSPSKVTTRYTGSPDNLTWSPDGKYLLYLSRRGGIGPGNNLLMIRSVSTGAEKVLSPDLRFVNQISWAPDGHSIIALGITQKESAIFKIDTETSAITKLAGQAKFNPHLCPDGKTLVFLKGGVMLISKLDLETGRESEIIKSAFSYDISPDGKEAVFSSKDVIKTIPLNGGEPKVLCSGLAKYYKLRWTGDGRNIIARAISNYDYEPSKIWRIPVQDGNSLQLGISIPKMISFALNPDNKNFVYSVSEESKSELWEMENFLPK
jgi:Tol biopolymer transport system component